MISGITNLREVADITRRLGESLPPCPVVRCEDTGSLDFMKNILLPISSSMGYFHFL
jgi:hypothetical protein